MFTSHALKSSSMSCTRWASAGMGSGVGLGAGPGARGQQAHSGNGDNDSGCSYGRTVADRAQACTPSALAAGRQMVLSAPCWPPLLVLGAGELVV